MADTSTRPGADDVHRFWFGDVTDWAACVRENNERWFLRGKALDAEVRERFSGLHAAAAKGDLDGWAATPRGALCLVLVLDQFPRHLFRGSAEAFASDARAQAVVRAGIEAGLDGGLSPVEQSFFYLPLEHAEDPDLQQQCVELMSRRADAAPEDLRKFMAEAVRYAEDHCAIVHKFGRFPHRNGVLGREDTPEERAWLEGGGQRFGQ